MKGFIIGLIALCLVTTSCAPDVAYVETDKRQFIVYKIEHYNMTHNTYHASSFTTLNLLALRKPKIVAPKGYMEIGDTLKIVNQYKK